MIKGRCIVIAIGIGIGIAIEKQVQDPMPIAIPMPIATSILKAEAQYSNKESGIHCSFLQHHPG
jgi:hypothetical protein